MNLTPEEIEEIRTILNTIGELIINENN